MRKLFVIFIILLSAGQVFGQWSYRHKPPLGKQINKAHPLSDFKAVWFFLEGSGNKVFDLSGNGYVGTFNGTIVWIPGKFGPALDFGASDYIDFGNVLDIATGNMTLIAWIKTTDNASTKDSIFIGKAAGDGADSWYLSKRRSNAGADANKLNFWLHDGATGFGTVSDNVINDGVWHQVVAVINWEVQSVTLYVDSILQTATGDLSVITQGNMGNSEPLRFGSHSDGSSRYIGQLDLPTIYNRASLTSEIALLYREPFGMFEDSPVVKMFTYPAPAGNIPIFMYHYMHHGYILLPLIPFGFYCWRKQKCAA